MTTIHVVQETDAVSFSEKNKTPLSIHTCGPGSSVGIATELQAGRSEDRIPVGGEIFRTCPDRPCGPLSLLYNRYRVFPWSKERPGRDADPSPPSSAVVLPLWVVWPVQSLSACTRVHFTFLPQYTRSEKHEVDFIIKADRQYKYNVTAGPIRATMFVYCLHVNDPLFLSEFKGT